MLVLAIVPELAVPAPSNHLEAVDSDALRLLHVQWLVGRYYESSSALLKSLAPAADRFSVYVENNHVNATEKMLDKRKKL